MPVNVPAKCEVRSFTNSWDISDWTFGRGFRTLNLGKSWERWGRTGWGMVPFERALVSSYRPSIVTVPLSLRVSEILPLLCSSTPFPTPPLLSPEFHHVCGWPLGYEEQDVGLIVRAISFQDFQPMWSWSTNVTDRRRDWRNPQIYQMVVPANLSVQSTLVL